VVLNRYYFDCDPRYCYPEAHQLKGYTLPELLERHPEQRLLLFSLGRTGFIWLAACAVYPELRWPLTLKLGWHLTDKDNTLIKSCLSRLAPLPWFRQGKIPDWMRLALLEELSEEQEQRVRGIMDEVLNFRGTDPAAVFSLDVVSRENRQSSDNDAWHDHVFLGFMDNRLAFRLPKEWRKQLRQVREQPITR
ncbi:MAG: hypothetical protein GY862_25815, partial [Gammaproteobacteria bacterium]|nr:hypothetical protein [Gammaproteobacteria bacterium]